jgi:hypothetical protein
MCVSMAARSLKGPLPPGEGEDLRAGFAVGARRLLIAMRDDPNSEVQRLVLALLMDASDN